MEGAGGGILGRLSEKVLGWIALALVALGAVAFYQTPAATKAALWSTVWRCAAWLVITGVLPWASRFVLGRVLEAGSNWAGVGLLGALLLLNILSGLLLMTGWPQGAWTWMLVLGMLALAGTYNYLVAEYLTQMRGGLGL